MDGNILISTGVMIVGMGEACIGKLLTGGGGWSKNLRIETELIKMEKLSVVPVVPLQGLSACGEEGLTMIVGWWKMGKIISFHEGNGLETR